MGGCSNSYFIFIMFVKFQEKTVRFSKVFSIVFLESSLRNCPLISTKRISKKDIRTHNLEYIQFPCTFPSALRSHISLEAHSSIVFRFYFFLLLPNNVLRNNTMHILAYRMHEKQQKIAFLLLLFKYTSHTSYLKLKTLFHIYRE